jgi:hypothetical protein
MQHCNPNLERTAASIRLLQTLQRHELGIPPVPRHQLIMAALLDHAAPIDDVDDIRLLDRAETVGDGDGGSAARGEIEGFLHDFFGF